jgi:hypothetical protein
VGRLFGDGLRRGTGGLLIALGGRAFFALASFVFGHAALPITGVINLADEIRDFHCVGAVKN